MLWEASVLSKRWAMHSNGTWLKSRKKQRCGLFLQKSLETDHKWFWWLKAQLKQAKRVCVLSSWIKRPGLRMLSSPEARSCYWLVKSEDPWGNLSSKFSHTGILKLLQSPFCSWDKHRDEAAKHWAGKTKEQTSRLLFLQSIQVISLSQTLCWPSTVPIIPTPLWTTAP